jgi:plasmid rolling circle replication initiator protein Rep
MSDPFSDGVITYSHSTPTDQDLPYLSDISDRDKPWDKHRANSDVVSGHYAHTQFNRYSERIDICSQLLDFKLSSDADEGSYKLKLSAARFCRVRHCPVCQWRRSLMWKAKAYKVLPKVVEQYPTHRWLFVTFTVRNCAINELRSTLTWMNESFKRLTKLKVWPAIGWIKSTEVTRGKDGSAHPHFHCLLLVPAIYFSGKGYMSKKEWIALWQKALRIDYKPIMDVQAVRKGDQPMQLVPELLKYCTKESDLIKDKAWLIEYTRQMHNVRSIGLGGVLKTYMSVLENEPDDLIGNDDKNSVDEGHFYFEWKTKVKRYKMIQD